jgi:thiamine biosynthesis protein ThiS
VNNTSIRVSVNGRPRELPAAATLPSLIDDLGVDRRTIAVAHNGDVIPRDSYDSVVLEDGDSVEVVRMVGGG